MGASASNNAFPRLLALLHNVPTDADYAMELISQRVAQGQEIKPLNRKRAAAKNPDTNDPSDVAARGPDEDGKSSRILKQGVSVLKTVADTVGGQRVSPFSYHTFTQRA